MPGFRVYISENDVEDLEVDDLHVSTYYGDAPDSPFHHAFEADAVLAICLDTDEHVAFH